MRWVMRCKIFVPLLLVLALAGCQQGPFKVSVRYDTLGKLKPRAPVYFENTPIGHVAKVVSTDKGEYLVELAIDPVHKDAMTTNAKFFIEEDPLDAEREAVLVRQEPPGGTALKEGSVVQGEKRQDFFNRLMKDLRSRSEEASRQLQQSMQELKDSLSQNSQHLNEAMQQSLDEMERSFQEFGRSLKSPVSEQDLKKLEAAVDAFIEQFKSLSADVQTRMREEVLPKLRSNLEALRRRLQEQGRKDDADKIDRQLDQLLTI